MGSIWDLSEPNPELDGKFSWNGKPIHVRRYCIADGTMWMAALGDFDPYGVEACRRRYTFPKADPLDVCGSSDASGSAAICDLVEQLYNAQ